MTTRPATLQPSTVIHPDDHMWRTGQDWYFPVGESGLQVVELAVRSAYLPAVTSILDLPCGHGRVTRFLRAAFPQADLYCCDVDRKAVDFCARLFAGVGIYSNPDLTTVELPSVDVIFVGSLFTHIDLARTRKWLTYLTQRLNPGGVIAATFHGHWSAESQKKYPMIEDDSWKVILQSYEETGFGYAAYPGGEHGDYGVSLTRPAVVCDIVSAIPGVRLVGYVERGWADNHDVVMIAKNDRLRDWGT